MRAYKDTHTYTPCMDANIDTNKYIHACTSARATKRCASQPNPACHSFLGSHLEENVQYSRRWNAAFAETVREAGNGPGSKGAGGGVAKCLCQFRLYTPITPHLPTLPQLNISYGGWNRLCHLWQRSRLATVLLGDSDRSREYCNMALNVVHSPLLPWSTNGIIANYNSSPGVAPTRCILRRLSLLCKSSAWHPCACAPLELCICLRLRHNRTVISVSRPFL